MLAVPDSHVWKRHIQTRCPTFPKGRRVLILLVPGIIIAMGLRQPTSGDAGGAVQKKLKGVAKDTWQASDSRAMEPRALGSAMRVGPT